MNTRQLATTLGVTKQSVIRWVRWGCPHQRRLRGLQVLYEFDLRAVKHWREKYLLPPPPRYW